MSYYDFRHFQDVDVVLQHQGIQQVWHDVAYVDDVALTCSDPSVLQQVLDCVVGQAALYGLHPN